MAAKPNGKATTKPATTNAVMWARLNHVPAAKRDPARVLHSSMAEAIAPNVSWPRATTKSAARERNQFKVDHASHTSKATVRKIRTALPGEGSVVEVVAPANRKAARQPRTAASDVAARNKFSSKRADTCQVFFSLSS